VLPHFSTTVNPDRQDERLAGKSAFGSTTCRQCKGTSTTKEDRHVHLQPKEEADQEATPSQHKRRIKPDSPERSPTAPATSHY